MLKTCSTLHDVEFCVDFFKTGLAFRNSLMCSLVLALQFSFVFFLGFLPGSSIIDTFISFCSSDCARSFLSRVSLLRTGIITGKEPSLPYLSIIRLTVSDLSRLFGTLVALNPSDTSWSFLKCLKGSSYRSSTVSRSSFHTVSDILGSFIDFMVS